MSTNYLRNELSEEQRLKLIFNVSSNVIPKDGIDQGFTDVYEEFINYKKLSADLGNIPIPEDSIQKEFLSIVDLFGKDKENHFPKPKAKKEGIHHIHVFDGLTDRDVENWSRKEQSKRSCNTLMFYSYFKHKGKTYFYVLKFVRTPEGHEFQRDMQEMSDVADEAERYRNSIVGHK